MALAPGTIEVERLTKSFRLYAEQYSTLKERALHLGRIPYQEFDAIRDIDFTVNPGTVLGLLGNNGSGKSTLLKCIARTIEPTSGHLRREGSLAALLELGAGFHPELTGRENVFLAGSIMGHTRRTIGAVFDEIVAFAELEEFIDNQVKHYSSGMYARLGFALAVSMEPDILLIDEILAVGDVAFQARCMQRIEEMGHGKEALTILFVSHDMDAIMRVCDRVIWIEEGRLVKDGDPEEVVTEYQNTAWSRLDATTSGKGRTANRWAEIMSVRVLSADGKEVGAPALEEPCRMRIRFRTNRGRLSVRCAVDVRARGQLLFRSVDKFKSDIAVLTIEVEEGLYRIPGWINKEDFVKNHGHFLNGVAVTQEDLNPPEELWQIMTNKKNMKI